MTPPPSSARMGTMGLGLAVFGLFGTLLLPMGTASMSARHLVLVATWSAAGLLGLAAAREGLRPAAFASRAVTSGLLLLTLIAIRGPLTVEGAEILLTWGGLLVATPAVAARLSRGTRRHLISLTIVAFVLVALEGLLETAFLLEARREGLDLAALPESARPFFASTRARSVFGQANGLGAFLGLFAPAVFLTLKVRAQRTRALLLAALLIGTLLATRSLGTAVAALMTLSLFALLRLRSKPDAPGAERWVLGAILPVGLTVGLIVGALVIREALGGAALSTEGPLRTLELRTGYWRSAWSMISQEPVLGIGWGLYADHLPDHLSSARYFSRRPHSAPLALGAELGFIGWLAVAWILTAFSCLVRPRAAATSERGSRSETDGSLAMTTGATAALGLSVFSGALGILPPTGPVTSATATAGALLALAVLVFFTLARPLGTAMSAVDGRRAVALGGVFLGLHALGDIDLWIPNLGAAFALLVLGGMDPKPPRPGPRSIAWQVAALCLPLFGFALALSATTAAEAEVTRRALVVERTRPAGASAPLQQKNFEAEVRAASARPISLGALRRATLLLVDQAALTPTPAESLRQIRATRELIEAAPRAIREAAPFRARRRRLERAEEALRSNPARHRATVMELARTFSPRIEE